MITATRNYFTWPDYLVFAISLLISAAIGIYHGFQSRKKQNTSEYLMGNRDMGILPVSASLVVSITSAIAILGTPAETYAYGMKIIMFDVGFSLAIIVACVFYMPIYHRLRITSMYQYLEMRFDHRVRNLCSFIALVQMMLYSSVALYAPSIAISQVTGMPYWACILMSAILCTFYTTLGGFKTVLWTDTVQATIMFIGLIATVSKGFLDTGGWSRVMNFSQTGRRLDFTPLEPDLFARHNIWSFLIGDLPHVLALYATGQFAVQRFCSVRSLNKARIALLGTIPINGLIAMMSTLTGLVAVAYYWGCDPLYSNKIQTRDQILPVLVMDVFRYNPGMGGIFLSNVLSAALSTLSSVQNSFAAVLYEDCVKPLKIKFTGRSFTERHGKIINQIIVFSIGATVLALALGVSSMGQLLYQMTNSALALSAGPALGVFSLGMFIPFANPLGALAGLVSGVAVLLWIIIGALSVNVIHTPLPLYNHLCNISLNSDINSTSTLYSAFNFTRQNMDNITQQSISDESSAGFALYRLSFRYYSTAGAIPTFIIGLIVSLITGGWKVRHQVSEQTLFSWSRHGIKWEWEAKEDTEEHDRKDGRLSTEPI